MATGRTLENETYAAAADLSAAQFKIVKQTANRTCNVAGAGELSVGVLQNKPKSGEAGTVAVLGRSKVLSDGSGTAIGVGDPLKPNASGVAVKAAAGDYAFATANDASSAANIVISCDLTGPFLVHA